MFEVIFMDGPFVLHMLVLHMLRQYIKMTTNALKNRVFSLLTKMLFCVIQQQELKPLLRALQPLHTVPVYLSSRADTCILYPESDFWPSQWTSGQIKGLAI